MKVVILCGGKGTRSYPFTEHLPKVMMPINGRPIIVHLMEIYACQGFTEFVLAAGHRKEILMDYFHNRFPQWKVDVVDTGDESDTAQRIFNCRDRVGNRFMATYGDGLGDVDLHGLLRFHESSGGRATLTTVPLRSQYGTIAINSRQQISKFTEKPIIMDCWINAGFFVFDKSVFDVWEGRNLEVDVFPNLAQLGEVYAYKHYGFWKSMDTSKDLQELERIYHQERVPWMPRAAASATPGSRTPVPDELNAI
jgi:glucose-1-phosphate cytidylyltransferase